MLVSKHSQRTETSVPRPAVGRPLMARGFQASTLHPMTLMMRLPTV